MIPYGTFCGDDQRCSALSSSWVHEYNVLLAGLHTCALHLAYNCIYAAGFEGVSVALNSIQYQSGPLQVEIYRHQETYRQ
jgi:hypothetical protein